jgi:hypothetical protein
LNCSSPSHISIFWSNFYWKAHCWCNGWHVLLECGCCLVLSLGQVKSKTINWYLVLLSRTCTFKELKQRLLDSESE